MTRRSAKRSLSVVVGSLLLSLLTAQSSLGVTGPRATFVGYPNTGVQTTEGLAVHGNFAWISDFDDEGHGANVVRVDVRSGATRDIASKLITYPTSMVASSRYAWAMNEIPEKEIWSLLRINAATLSVKSIPLPLAGSAGIGYEDNAIILAGNSIWIPGVHGLLRVNTKSLKVTQISSPLIYGTPLSVVADAHYLWMNASYAHVDEPSGPAPDSFVRVSLVTGKVAKVTFPGVKGGFPVGDDGTNFWVQNASGIDRVDPATGQFVAFAVPKDVQIAFQESTPSAVAHGCIYFTVGIVSQMSTGVVAFNLATGAATVLSSRLIYQPGFAASDDGDVWIANRTELSKKGIPVRQPTLVRVSWSNDK